MPKFDFSMGFVAEFQISLRTVAAFLTLSGCGGSASLLPGAHSQGALIPRSTRELTDAEKVSLATSLRVNFREPNAIRFRWLPITYQSGEQQVEYCGLAETKNSVAAYSGYEVFHAILQADPLGKFTSGIVDHPRPNLGHREQIDGQTYELCRRAGYLDFSQAK
jgi:hypothetical protein